MIRTSLTTLASVVILCSASAVQVPIGAVAADRQGVLSQGSKPLVNSFKLQSLIHGDNLYERSKKLYEIAKLSEHEHNHPTRVIGSDGHRGTLDYIYSTIAGLGDYFTLANQSFPAVMGNVFESRLVLGDKVFIDASPMSLTPPTKDREPVHGHLVHVKNNGCEASDYPFKVSGAVALIRRGSCAFGSKSELAGKAGAITAIVYNYENGSVHGTLGTPSPDHIATFGLSGEDAAPVLAELEKGNSVEVMSYINAEVKAITTTNIIAQTTGGDPENCIMLGGHSDSVDAGAGINDDGSGTVSLLEVAAQLSKFTVNNCVRFAWWAGEEEGLLGSDYYVSVLPDEDNKRIRLFQDFDMMASPNWALQVYNATNAVNPTGSEELRDLYIAWYTAHGYNYTLIPFDGRSDYDAFIRNGIPGGGIATGAEGIKTEEEEKWFGGKAGEWYDPNYHQIGDDLENLNMTAFELNTKLIAHAVATYALSFAGFPPRSLVKSEGLYESHTKYHGSKLFI